MMHDARHSDARRTAFTLIEVMLAVVIMGLGILGLSALFAGAAGQQQRSTQQNQSVGFARSAESMLSRSLGRIQGKELQQIIPGEWRRLVADPADKFTLVPETRVPYGLYFLTRADGVQVYENPNPNPQSITDGLGAGASEQGPFAELHNSRPALPDARIHPSGVRVTVTIGQRDPDGTVFETERVFVSSGDLIPDGPQDPYLNIVLTPDDRPDLNSATNGAEANFNQANYSTLQSLATGGTFPQFREFILLSLRSEPRNDAETAYMEFLVLLPDVATSWIRRIEATYDWRNARLVSLNDRIAYESDDQFPGGRRPLLGYTGLWRSPDSGGLQLIILTYAMQPVSSPAVNQERVPFIPPETPIFGEDDERAFVRRANVELRFDEDTDQFYVLASDDNPRERAAVEPGQLLVMAVSSNIDPTDPMSRSGADFPVRVITQRRDPANATMLRGYLDASPRVKGVSPLRQRDGGAAIEVFYLNPLVESISSDQTEWRIRPIEARQFQLGVDF